MATVAVSIAENTSGSRALTIRVAAKRNAAVVEELSFVQASMTAEGYLSIPDLRKLLPTATTPDAGREDARNRGVERPDNNYYDNCIALQSALKANWWHYAPHRRGAHRKPGEELEIDLKGRSSG